MLSITETKDHELLGTLCADVQNLHHTLHPNLFKPHDAEGISAAIKTFLEDKTCKAYLVKNNSEPAGYILMYIKNYSENAFAYASRAVYIDQIIVLPKHRCSGAGKLLMQQAEKLAKENGISRLELDHWSTNTVAASFFRNRGYSLYKERLFKFI